MGVREVYCANCDGPIYRRGGDPRFAFVHVLNESVSCDLPWLDRTQPVAGPVHADGSGA